jgi:hypothetical protein
VWRARGGVVYRGSLRARRVVQVWLPRDSAEATSNKGSSEGTEQLAKQASHGAIDETDVPWPAEPGAVLGVRSVIVHRPCLVTADEETPASYVHARSTTLHAPTPRAYLDIAPSPCPRNRPTELRPHQVDRPLPPRRTRALTFPC